MRKRAILAGLASALVVCGCVVMPAGPMVAALPGSSATPDQFRMDDDACRMAAQAAVSGAGQAASNNVANNAALSTIVGAAAGALIGSAGGDAGAGAAIGAGTGLLFGSAAGSGYAGASSYDLQYQYDATYLNCMYARGHRVPASFVRNGYRQRYGTPGYGYPPRDYPAPYGGGGAPGPSSYPPPNTPPPRS